MKKSRLLIIGLILGLLVLSVGIISRFETLRIEPKTVELKENEADREFNIPSFNTSITPKPSLTADEWNKLYGPCSQVRVIMYHHIEEETVAIKGGYKNLNVTPDFFRKHMEYLLNHGYNIIFVDDIAYYFDKGIPLPGKAVAITFDDAYEDNFTKAYPIMKELGIKGTIFTPTGLVNNPNYLTWDQINEMQNSGLVRFGNHTWSHHSSAGTLEVQEMEIKTAATQLHEKGLDKGNIFAYPYGKPSLNAETILDKYAYRIAFTTVNGTMMCKQKRFELPRVRVGNNNLNNYGF